MSKDLMTVEGTAVQPYGAREEVREITDRLMALHPAAPEVGQKGMTAVAQLAVMTGANPLPSTGEIHIWVDRGRPVVDFGIAYYRRIAAEKDTVVWMDGHEPRAMNAREREEYGILDGDLGSVCKGFLLSEYLELLKAGVPWQQAQRMLARTSIAIVAHDEMFYARDAKYSKKGDPRTAPTGRTWQWVCDKRAEKGFYRMKALVDTTLTDAIKKRTEKMLAQLEYAAGERAAYEIEERESAFGDMSLEEVNSLLFDADTDAIEGEYADVSGEQDEEVPTTEPESATAPEKTTSEGKLDDSDTPPDNLRDFAAWFAGQHPFYADNKHVVKTLLEEWDDVGITFKQRAVSDYVAYLEQRASQEADAA